MGERARHLWNERYSPERGLENLEQAYRSSLAATTHAPRERRSCATAVRVVIIHSRYLSGQTSGENRVVEDEARILSEGGARCPGVVAVADRISAHSDLPAWESARSGHVRP